MAGSVNKVILVGNLGRDPEIRNTQDGRKVVNLRSPHPKSGASQSGERKERTEWHRVAIFNENLAEVAEKYLKKGAKILSRASCRRGNGPTSPVPRNTPPRSSCSATGASSPCSTASSATARARATSATAAISDDPARLPAAAARARSFDKELDDEIPF